MTSPKQTRLDTVFESDFPEPDKNKGEWLECSECDTEFWRPWYNIREGNNYCSRECQWDGMRTGPASYHLESSLKGYPAWVVESKYITVHSLIAVANGEDPHDVFANPRMSVDHVNGCKLDNRPSNIRLMDISEHGRKDRARQSSMGYSHKEMLAVIEYMLSPRDFIDRYSAEGPEEVQTTVSNPG